MDKNIKKEYPESELTSEIINCIFKVYNKLGFGLSDEAQLLGYIKANKIRIGLLLTITNSGVKIKRLIN